MKKAAGILALLAIAGLAAFIFLTLPRPLPASAIVSHTPDLANGKLLYTIGGCISCHLPPETDKTADKSLPSGGHPLVTPIGTLYPPNITPDKATGIGNWSEADFVNAMQLGLAPSGRHLIPAFPYTSYARMKMSDILDIRAYLMTLKPVSYPFRPADIPFPWLLRRGIGLWQLLAVHRREVRPDPSQSAAWNRGAYLVKGPGHCGECHTPRNIFMVAEKGHWLEGGPHPEGKGQVPSLHNLTEPNRKKLYGRAPYKDAATLVEAFQWGPAFGYDKLSSGGMGSVQTNLSQLPETDLKAIATYLTSLK